MMIITFATPAVSSISGRIDRLFDEDWKFHRGRCPTTTAALSSCADPSFNDSGWRDVRLPHDWSIEDLPAREEDAEFPVLGVRYGEWKLQIGDDGNWSSPGYDDSRWMPAKGGEDWRSYGAQWQAANVTGWYRQRLTVSEELASSAATVTLSLGTIAGTDETFLNGVRLGGTGSFDRPVSPSDYVVLRAYPIPAGLLVGSGGTNVIAIRSRTIGGPGVGPANGNGSFPGGLFDDPIAPVVEARVGPFDPAAALGSSLIEGWKLGGSTSTGYTLGGVGWYRKTFSVDPGPGRRVFLRFDGVYMNATTWLNGVQLGTHPYGYTTFEYDITKHLNTNDNSDNLVAVLVNNNGWNSRWYSGSGIYRHTHLRIVDAVHIPLWGAHVTTPSITFTEPGHASHAVVAVDTQVRNALALAAMAKVEVVIGTSDFVSPAKSATLQLDGNETKNITVSFELAGANQLWLWSTDSPTLYLANITVTTAGGHTDSLSVAFGVRTVSVSAATGLLLNGVPIKLYGGCVHHANGPLGARAIDRAEERRVELLKAIGYNAIRTSHNPVSERFLDACDRLGVLVMEETFDCWSIAKHNQDYHLYFEEWWQRDTAAMVLRDRSRPSVIMWSIGNEVRPGHLPPAGLHTRAHRAHRSPPPRRPLRMPRPDPCLRSVSEPQIPNRWTDSVAAVAVALRDYVHALDPGSGRAVTSAYPMLQIQDSKFLHDLDVAGYNYAGPGVYALSHSNVPNRTMVGTESWGVDSFQMWSQVWSMEYLIGDFIWTAMDYLGETAIGAASATGDVDEMSGKHPFPWHVSNCGDLDIVGHQKAQSVYRTVLWGVEKMAMLVHVPDSHLEQVSAWGWPEERSSWTFPGQEGEVLQVRVFARGCERVELMLNQKRVGSAPVQANFTAVFNVTYAPGTLEATCANGTEAIADRGARLTTAGRPVALTAAPDRATIRGDPDDLSYVTIVVVDADGSAVPDTAGVLVRVALEGPAQLLALGSGDPKDPTSFSAVARTAWRGRLVAIIQPIAGAAVGAVTLRASAPGLANATALITTVASPSGGAGHRI